MPLDDRAITWRWLAGGLVTLVLAVGGYAVNQINTHVDETRTSVGGLPDQLAAIRREITEAKETARVLVTAEVQRVEGKTAEEMRGLHADIDRLRANQGGIAALDVRVSRLESDLRDLKAELRENRRVLEETHRAATDNARMLNEISRRLFREERRQRIQPEAPNFRGDSSS
jgi:chromosome segregation ATPase